MGLKNRAIAIGLVLAWALGPAALADNVHWTGGGDQVSWSDWENWDKGQDLLPDAGDRVIISGDVDTVVDQDFTIDSIQIGSLATVTIQDSTLTLENDDHNAHECSQHDPPCERDDDHQIDGQLILCDETNPCGGLVVGDNTSHFFNGTGQILASETGGATISIASGVTMTNNLGSGIIGAIEVNGGGTFNNITFVNANGTMTFSTGGIEDVSGAAWYTGCGGFMEFNVGSTDLEGDFSDDTDTFPGSGHFSFNADVKTCGAWVRNCGSITLANNATFKYADFVAIAGCTNPGSGTGGCSDPYTIATGAPGLGCPLD